MKKSEIIYLAVAVVGIGLYIGKKVIKILRLPRLEFNESAEMEFVPDRTYMMEAELTEKNTILNLISPEDNLYSEYEWDYKEDDVDKRIKKMKGQIRQEFTWDGKSDRIILMCPVNNEGEWTEKEIEVVINIKKRD